MTKELLLDGLDPQVASRIQHGGANRSLGDSLGWTFDQISKLIGMSEQEIIAGNRLLRARFDRRKENLDTCQFALTQGAVRFDDKDIQSAIKTLQKAEEKHEAELNLALEEVLRPECVDKLVRQLIQKNRVDFASIKLVSDRLRLEESQVASFETASDALRKTLFQRVREGKTAPGDLTREPEIEKYMLKAENSLSRSQFEVFAQSVGIVPPDMKLVDYFKTVDSRTRSSLARRYVIFRAIAKELKESGT
jgi:hypothetical protein